MDTIRSALEDVAGYLGEHPEAGVEPDTAATAVLVDGLRCRVEGPADELTTDMATALGGGRVREVAGDDHRVGQRIERQHRPHGRFERRARAFVLGRQPDVRIAELREDRHVA